jgi:thiol-disulfide isomerase/thioredoxin
MSLGLWVLLAAVVVSAGVGLAWTLTNGVFRGTRRLGRPVPTSGAERPARPPVASVLAGTAYDARRGERATLLQFSSAFCAPCRSARRTLADAARSVPGVAHVEIDAEHHLELVRELGVLRTPTTLVLDGDGREITRATGAPRPGDVLAVLQAAMA